MVLVGVVARVKIVICGLWFSLGLISGLGLVWVWVYVWVWVVGWVGFSLVGYFWSVPAYSYVFLAVMDLTFLIMLILRDGLGYGIFVFGRPLWLDIMFPFVIVPLFYMLRFCTTYILVFISIERYIALSNLISYKTKWYSYIFLVTFYSSRLY